MPTRVHTLPVLLVLMACTQQPVAPAAPASRPAEKRYTFGGVTNAAGFLGGLAKLPPETPEDMRAALEWWENVQRAWDLLHDLHGCFAEGLGSDTCADDVWAGACHMYLQLGVDAAPEFQLLGLPFDALCRGEPRLKCCKYDPATEVGCHTAFNSPRPINCEGNWTTPNAESYGSCIWAGDPLGIGCTCCQIAECWTPACDPASLTRQPDAAWRVDAFAKKLADSFKRLARADPDSAADFTMMIGCTAHRDVMLHLAPFAMPDSLPADPDPGPDFHVNDNDPDARYLRGLTTMAVRRVLGGVPNAVGRWEAATARLWSDAEIEAAAATAGDADAVLGRLLGPFGLAMIKDAEPRRYKLLAVRQPTEFETANESIYVAGCVPAQPPAVGVEVIADENRVTARLDIQDPLSDRMPLGHYPAAVDFGDGRLEQVFLLSPSQSITHEYAAPGTYAVRAYTVNAAGLIATAEAQVVAGPPQGPADPGPVTVASVAPALTAVTNAYAPPHLTVSVSSVDSSGEPLLLGHLYAAPPARPGGYAIDRFAVHGTATNFLASPVGELRLSATSGGGNVVYSVGLLLGSIRLTAWDGSVATVVPTPADVQWIPAGAIYPVAPLIDPSSGALMLPAAGEQISVRWTSGGAPFAGCRPIYAPVTAVMTTADGGCKDLTTGLVWSLPSPPATFAQAQAYCAGLTQGGAGGWRLPTDNEILGVVGAGKAGTFFAFPTSGVGAWTTSAWFGASHITRELGSGGFGVTSDTSTAAALCVR